MAVMNLSRSDEVADQTTNLRYVKLINLGGDAHANELRAA
jgi:hypothetical protein